MFILRLVSSSLELELGFAQRRGKVRWLMRCVTKEVPVVQPGAVS